MSQIREQGYRRSREGMKLELVGGAEDGYELVETERRREHAPALRLDAPW